VRKWYVIHGKMFPSLFPQCRGSTRNSWEGLSPILWIIALVLCLSSCDSALKLTTDLGVGGSNPSGRARLFRHLRIVRSSVQLICDHFVTSLDRTRLSLFGVIQPINSVSIGSRNQVAVSQRRLNLVRSGFVGISTAIYQ